jgi:hypothetical protein
VTRLHFCRFHVALAGLAFFAACSKDASRVPKAFPGALTKRIDSYTGDEFYDVVKKLSYSGGQERVRECKNDPGCQGPKPTKTTKVQVDAVTTQDSIAASNVPQYGVIYVRALNKGDAEEARYGMLPGNQFEYYLIITGDSAIGMKWRLEQLNTTPNARRHSQTGAGAFVPCPNHTWFAGAKADFKSCAKAASGRDTIVRLGLTFQAGGDPIWVVCAMGCCIVQ